MPRHSECDEVLAKITHDLMAGCRDCLGRPCGPHTLPRELEEAIVDAVDDLIDEERGA